MSVTFAGQYRNLTGDMFVKQNEDGLYYIAIKTFCECGHACCSRPQIGDRPHTNGLTWSEEDSDGAFEYLEALAEKCEEDYDDYLEENRYEIVQMERYQEWKGEH